MEEKVLVKSEFYPLKVLVIFLCLFGLILASIISFGLYGEELIELNHDVAEWQHEYERISSPSVQTILEFNIMQRDRVLQSFIMVIVQCTSVFWVISVILCLAWARNELVVSNKRVYGKAAFRKRVDLPVDSISAVGSTWPKGVAVATSSGRISFLMIKNRDEIHQIISKLMADRQSDSSATIKQEIPLSSADELKKYKELLDSGVIKQEEFDAVKKRLLGL